MNHPNRTGRPCFVLKINTATLGDDWKPDVLRLMESVCVALYQPENSGLLFDREGRRIGSWTYKEPTP